MQYITERRHFHPDIQLPGISPYIRLKLYLPTLSGRSQTFLQRTTAHPIWSDWNLHLTSLSLPCCYFGHFLCSRAVYICYRLLKLSLQSSKNHKIYILCHDIHSSGCKCSWVSLFTMHDQCKEITAHTGSICPWDERQVSTDPTYQNNQLKQKTNCFFRVFCFLLWQCRSCSSCQNNSGNCHFWFHLHLSSDRWSLHTNRKKVTPVTSPQVSLHPQC